ncbi:hypothetical protein OSB04_026546 [Centaurea solstitialis]|uniref:Uncharacterized protein n=1 Tax=Centaurea solstitialis TaxID=347529 RepID=A0AA38SPM6_9ASTR|nr:hypothetical protein OSB04_026546 [Centaurea solstitialis]
MVVEKATAFGGWCHQAAQPSFLGRLIGGIEGSGMGMKELSNQKFSPGHEKPHDQLCFSKYTQNKQKCHRHHRPTKNLWISSSKSSLPIAKVMRLLKKDSMAGSLGNLYNSIKKLDDVYMQPNQSEDSILNPKLANYGFMSHYCSLTIMSPWLKSFTYVVIRLIHITICPSCHFRLNKELSYVAGSSAKRLTTEGGGFVKPLVAYMITDDLEVTLWSTVSTLASLSGLGVEKNYDLEEKAGLMLLKASFECKNVLTKIMKAIMGFGYVAKVSMLMTASFADSTAATSSASVVDKATIDCKRDLQLMAVPPKLLCKPNIRPCASVPFKYRNAVLTAVQCDRPGFARNRLTTPTQCARSGRVHTMAYMRLPTALAYGTFNISAFSLSSFGQSSLEILMCFGSGVLDVLAPSRLNRFRIF